MTQRSDRLAVVLAAPRAAAPGGSIPSPTNGGVAVAGGSSTGRASLRRLRPADEGPRFNSSPLEDSAQVAPVEGVGI